MGNRTKPTNELYSTKDIVQSLIAIAVVLVMAVLAAHIMTSR